MIGLEEFLNIVKREATRVVQTMMRPDEIGIFDSYDPNTHSIKVTLQPYGHKTGWLPIGTGHVGNQFGLAIGPQDGDQFVIGFRNGNHNTPYIKGRIFSDKDKPPKVESGEIKVQNKKGTNIFIDKDDNVTVMHSTGAYHKIASDGTITHNAVKSYNVTSGQPMTFTGGGNLA